nr:ribonuclease H-like domain-containing protein [Tanacetum cinerariifolium]
AEEKSSKALMAIDEVGWDWSYMANEEDHALVADGEAPTEFALTTNIENKEVKLEKDGLDGKLAGLLKASKNLDHLIESQRSDQKDLSWTGLPEFVDDTVTNYSRPSPTVVSTSAEGQNKDSFTSEDVASPNPPKPFVKRRIQRETTRSQKYAYESPSHRYDGHIPHGAPMRPPLRSSGHKPHRGSMRPPHRSTGHRPHGPTMNPRRPTMNGARPYKSFFIQLPSYETRPFLKSSAVKTPYRAPWVPTINMYDPPVNRKFSTSGSNFPTANRKFPTASRKFTTGSTNNHTADVGRKGKPGSSQNNIDDKGGCKITGKGTIKTGKLEFENVYFVKDLKYNLFSMSQICDNKNSVLFTDSECIMSGRNFKLLDDTNILLRTPRQHNMYSIDLNNIVPHKDLTCLVAKASVDECILWHRRLGHLNVKTMNKLVRHNLVRGLPTKVLTMITLALLA